MLLQKFEVFPLVTYIDVDLAAWSDDRRSTRGWCILLKISLISWSFGKHRVVF